MSTVTKYDKLIRDHIPENVTAQGSSIKYHALDPVKDADLLKTYVLKKIMEEATEVFNANSIEECIAELADLLTVMHKLTHCLDVDWEQVEDAFLSKQNKAGNFYKNIILEEITRNKDDQYPYHTVPCTG